MFPVDLLAPTIAPTTAALGRKATTLHRLSCGGLPVPPAFALSWKCVAAIEHGDTQACANASRAASTLGYPIAVRSSTNIEDRSGGAAPGLFESVLDVQNNSELFAAIDTVIQSTRTPLVSAYLEARGIRETPTIAIVLQEQIRSSRGSGVLYSRPPGKPFANEAILEVPDQPPIWIDRNTSQTRQSDITAFPTKQVIKLWELARDAEEILGCDRGVDVEWVWDDRGPWLIQARPIVHRDNLQSLDRPEIQCLLEFSRDNTAQLWRLDATHNPFPCSPAQAGLVEAVRDLAPYDMRIVGGYLYTAKRTTKKKLERLEEREIENFYHNVLLPKMNTYLAVPESQESPSLACALNTYRDVFRCYTEELSPRIASIGRHDEGSNPLSIWLQRANRGELSLEALLEAVAPIAPAWDVSVQTYGETPEIVKRAISLTVSMLPENGKNPSKISIRESDDILFFRAQYQVRRALLAISKRWDIGDSVFFMSLSELVREEGLANVPQCRIQEAQDARDTHVQQRQVEMPLAFINGEAVPTRLPPDAEIWRGIGTGGSVVGRVVRVEQLHGFPTIRAEDRTVLVMPTVSPAHALAARGALAVICEYGDHLGHGAAMARELDIPCIVGCRRAWRELKTGDQVSVHGQAGLVARLKKV